MRILQAAEAVFTEGGPEASTEEVARRAGVAIGTVFRHFPTKQDLLVAIMKRLREQLAAEAGRRDLFGFFAYAVAQAAGRRIVVDIELADAFGPLEESVAALLRRAHADGAVAATVELPEVMALLVSLCQGALHQRWDEDLQARTLAVVLAGLRRR
ncbi:helix-turn-helix domain-containing protein [Actinoplanes sp. NPDC000266]